MRTAIFLFFCSFALLAAGCGLLKNDPGAMTGTAEGRVNCIGVLPAVSEQVAQGAAGEAKAKSLLLGTEAMDRLLQQELQGQANVRFVGQDLLAGLELTGGENSLEMARLVGKRIGCSAVMETTVSRFVEREGGKYSVENPAAVAFDIRLFDIESGSVLWSANFDEAQKAVSENLYELKKAKSRGFSWVTAEGLMREGLRAKLGNSPYFKGTVQAVPVQPEPAEK
jgi:hypothetical protein